MVAKLARVSCIFMHCFVKILVKNSGSQSLIRCIKQKKKNCTGNSRSVMAYQNLSRHWLRSIWSHWCTQLAAKFWRTKCTTQFKTFILSAWKKWKVAHLVKSNHHHARWQWVPRGWIWWKNTHKWFKLGLHLVDELIMFRTNKLLAFVNCEDNTILCVLLLKIKQK